MERSPPRRCRGGRRKGECRIVMLGMPALFDLFGTKDIDVVLAKLDDIGARPKWVSGLAIPIIDRMSPSGPSSRPECASIAVRNPLVESGTRA